MFLGIAVLIVRREIVQLNLASTHLSSTHLSRFRENEAQKNAGRYFYRQFQIDCRNNGPQFTIARESAASTVRIEQQ